MTVSVASLRQWSSLPEMGDDTEADNAEFQRVIDVATDMVAVQLANPLDINKPAVEQAVMLVAVELVKAKSAPSLWIGDGQGGGQSLKAAHVAQLLSPYKKLVFV